MADEIQNTGIQFEDIVPWVDDHGDTGLSARLKLKRNFDKIKAWMDANHIDVGAVKEIIEEYGVELFLSKLNDDTAAGFITFLQGLQVGNQFVSGLLGEGGVFRRDADGKVYIEADKLYVRMKAYFDNVEIKDYEHTSGNRIASKAGLKCVKVEAYNADDELIEENPQTEPAGTAYYRLYFRAKDGEDTIDNNFVVGDQAFCDKTTFDNNVLAHHRYWRLVVGRNSTLRDDEEFGYIDLSASDKESGSAVPLAGDDVSQLGNRTDVERQGAIIEFVGGENAPAYQIYQGINTYSLSNKCKIDIGFDSQTGLARMNVAGNFRFGSPVNTGSYIKYDSQANQGQGQLDIKAHVEFTNSDEELNEIVQGHQKKYDDDIANLESVTEDLQKQIDGAIETWFMTGVPTLQNAPANEWTTDDEKDKHIGDLYYDKTTGHGYRFMYDDEEEVYLWTILTDEDVTEALRLAAQAQETADGKRTVYSVWGAWMKNNVNTLEVGDLFIPAANTTQGGITYKAKKVYKCTTDGSATFEEIAYTDDSKFNGYIDALLNDTGLSGDVAAAAAQRAILSALGVGTVVSGGLLLTSLIGMRQYNGGDKSQLSSYTTWAGISGQYDANVLGGGMAAWYGGGMLDKETLTASQISQQGWNTLRWAKGVDRFDGSGYRADGNISWDKNGALTIKNITTLSDSNNKNILNELATFNSAFTFGTSGQGSTTALYITPQVPFESLYIGTSNANKQEVATKNWVNQNFVTTTFFDSIFRLYNGTESAGNKIDVNGTLPTDKTNLNIEAMFGFWTKKYISALGQGDDGTTSYTTLAQLNDVQFGTLTNGDALVYNATLNKWENKQIEVGVDMSVVWDALLDNTNEQINISHITTALSNYITSDNLSTILTGYATSTQLNALEYLSQVTAGNGVLKLITNKSTEYYVDLSHEHSFLELLDRPDTIAGYGITLTADDIPMLTKSKISDFPATWVWSAITGTPNSIAGYGITDAKIENGVITLGGNSITPLISETYRGTVVSVGLSVPAGFLISGTPITDSGTLAVSYASGYEGFTTDLKNKINALFSWFEVDENGDIKTKDYVKDGETKHRGFWSESFVSALGRGDDSGGGGTGDVTWDLLANPATGGRHIDSSYITTALAPYATQSWVTQNFATQAALESLEFVNSVNTNDGVLSLVTNKGNGFVVDLTHEHSWFDIQDRPDTLKGYGITDAKIADGAITLGANTITPITSHQALYTLSVYGGSTKVLDFKPNANASLYIKAGGDISLTNDATNKYITLSYSHPTNGANTTITAANGKVLSAITVNSLGHVTSVSAKTLAAADIPDLGGTYAAAGRVTTLEGYFTNGVAKKAAQLNTSHTLWGNSFNGTADIDGNIVMNSADGTYIQIGGIRIVYDAGNNALKVVKSDGTTAANFYATGGVSALGKGEEESHEIGVLNDLNDVNITNAVANQILVFDGTHWRNQNQQSVYELPVATTTTLGGIMLGYAASGKNYALQLDANGKAYVNVPWSDTTYTLPTASADTLGGIKIGTTLAITSGVLNLPTTGVIAGTYKRVTVDAYGRVTSGDNTDIDTNTWRNIYVGGVSKVGTGIDTKAINFKAGSNVAISYAAAGTGSGQSGSANYFDVVISATDTTYSDATQSVAGLMSAADKKKLDGIAEGANKYSLPLAASGIRGGVQIGYSETNSGTSTDRNYAVQLSSEKMYVNVPWVNTWRGIQNNLTSDSTTDSLSAAQGKTLKGYIDTLNSYFSSGVAKSAAKLTTVSKTAWGQTFWTSDGVPTSISGALSSVTNITMSGYIKIGDAYLSYDSTNNAIRVSANADGTGAVNFYAIGGVSALGQSEDGSAGVGDVTWDLLATQATNNRTIHLSYISAALASYLTTNSYIQSSAISDMATKTWVGQQGYLKQASLSNYYTKSEVYTKTEVNALARVKAISASNDGLTFTWQDDTTTIADFSHEHSFLELLDRPSTIAGYGISLTADDIPNLPWGKITSGKPTTISGYGITDAVTSVKIGTNSYAPASGIVTLPAYPTNYYSNTDSRTANTVLAAPNGSNGVATFRSLVAADIPTLTKSKISDFPTSWAWSALTGVPTTLAGYGITDAKIVDGVITLGANAITPVTSVAMSVPTGFSVSGSPISKTGTLAVSYASGYEGFTTTLKNKIDLLYSLFTREGSGTSADPYIIKANYGLYTEKFLSALGQGDDGQSGVGDVTWTLLASQATDGRTIHTSYLTQALSGYATQSWVTNQNYATQTWVTVQGYATSASVTAAIGALTYFNAAALVTDGTIKLSGHGVEDAYLDFTHQHSWFDIQDRPDTLTGFGITIAASDIPNLDWSKITTGKPTTIAGYGIADGVTQVKIGTTAYTPTGGVISLPAYPTVPTKVSQLTNDSGYITSSASITGNSASATKLKNTIKLWGNDFDGTANVGDTIIFDEGDSGRQVRISKGGLFEFRAGTGGWAGGLFATSNDGSTTLGAFGYNGSGDTLTYLFIGDNFSSPWVSFLPNGRVGIGTRTPTCELDVSGSANATTLYENGNRVITTANIGSQSVNYATSAGSATTATTASKLSTVSKTLFGNTYWTSGGVPTSIGVSGANASLSYVANITMSGALKIGDIYLTYDSANNAIRVSKNADGTGIANFYAIGGVSALGQGEDGSAGAGDVTWALLASTATGGRFIDVSYISGAMGNYLTANGYVRTVDITDMATRTWVGQQGYITSASIPNSVVSLSKVLDGVVRFGYNNGSSDDIDLTHEHSWFDIQDRPNTLTGFGITLTAADIPNLSWSKITSGKPTTVAGYGITDAITTGNIGNQSVSYATTAGTANSVSWGNVGNKPSAAGNGTTPVYWTGSGFTACTPYSSASVNYANSAGSVDWANVTSHPTKLSQFTNDSGYVTSSGVTSVATGTGLTGGTITSTGTISINSTYQTYISHGESAYNSLGNYLPLAGGDMNSGARISFGGGNGYIGNANNAGWLMVQDICSQNGAGDTYWSLRTNGTAHFTEVISSGGVTALSDARHKTIVRNTNISVEQIAAMRSVVYRWSDRRDNSLHVGSIAQDWQGVLPQVVSVADDKEHTLGLQYGVAALIAVITTARKVVDHEKRITELEKERDAWKEAYSFIKNAYEELKLKIA